MKKEDIKNDTKKNNKDISKEKSIKKDINKESYSKEASKERKKKRKADAKIKDSKSVKNKNKSHKLIVPAIIIVLVSALCVGFYFYVDSLAYKKVNIEAGNSITASDLIKKGDSKAYFTKDSDEILFDTPGEYNVVVMSKRFKHKVVVNVVDTIAPTASVNNLYCSKDDTLSADLFVDDIVDATKVSIDFDTAPDFKHVGKQNLSIVLTDKGDNKTYLSPELTVLPFKTRLSVEAGNNKPKLSDFRISDETYLCEDGFDSISMNHVGEYSLAFSYGNEEYSVLFSVVDTASPIVQFTDYDGFVGENITPEDFVVSATDKTDLTYSFAEDFQNKEGAQYVTVIVTDEGGNEVSENCKVSLKIDSEAPVIEEANDIEVYEGNSVSYLSHISVSDNCMNDLDIKVSAEGVDTDTPGTYPITYTVTDVGGNTATASVNVIVKERSYSMDEINARADEILASILTPDMSDYDKCWAIFNYVRTHVIFQDKSDKDSYVKACYEGVIGNHGDCYVYACTCQTLLTRAGITNMMIERIPTRTTHFWNLVDYGEGWYHMDTTPRVPDHPTVFMWTEAQIQEYSAGHWRCYNYDHDQYPVTN